MNFGLKLGKLSLQFFPVKISNQYLNAKFICYTMGNLMPKVTVILTSFNHSKYLKESIDSVLDQTFTDFELIIWDDCSSDNSWKIIGSYTDPRIKAYQNPYNMGGGNVNRALQLATGRYVAIHHSDDVWELHKLERQVAFLDLHHDVGAVFSNALAISENGTPFKDHNHFYSSIFDQRNRSRHEWLNRFFYYGNALCHPSILIRKECYQDCGPYRPGLAQLPDFDMWIRLCLKYDIHVLPEKLVRFRILAKEANSSGSRPSTRIRSINESYIILKNYLKISRFDEMVAIFPEANKFSSEDGFDAGFVLAMVALETAAPQWAKLLAIEVLFDLAWSTEKATRIERIYGFTAKDLPQITANNDPFAVEVLRVFAEQREELELSAKNHQDYLEHHAEIEAKLAHEIATLKSELSQQAILLAEQERVLAARDKLIDSKDAIIDDLYDSLSWKITAPLRKVCDAFHLERVLKGAATGPQSSPIDIKIPDTVSNKLDTYPTTMPPKEILHFPTSAIPVVSIIIPVFEQFGYTFSCLTSILKNSTASDYEIIIADDCSQDETKDISLYVHNISQVSSVRNSLHMHNYRPGLIHDFVTKVSD